MNGVVSAYHNFMIGYIIVYALQLPLFVGDSCFIYVFVYLGRDCIEYANAALRMSDNTCIGLINLSDRRYLSFSLCISRTIIEMMAINKTIPI